MNRCVGIANYKLIYTCNIYYTYIYIYIYISFFVFIVDISIWSEGIGDLIISLFLLLFFVYVLLCYQEIEIYFLLNQNLRLKIVKNNKNLKGE